VRKIYDYFEFELHEETLERMQRFLEENKRHKHGVHEYNLSTFGLDASTASKHFDAYTRRYGIERTVAH
jgi:hypothetical protein